MKQRDANQIPAGIQWHDGLLLEPQHFQESARRSERLLDYHLGYLSPFHYGFVLCQIDDKQLPSGLLRINQLEAVMPDGLVVRHPFPGRKQPKEIQLDLTSPDYKVLFDRGPVTVYLAVAGENVEGAAARDEARYDTDATAFAYDEVGHSGLEVPRLVPRLRLVVPEASSAPPSTQVAMPFIRVKRRTKGYEEDVTYEPPRLGVARDSVLYALCGTEIIQPLREKAGRLATTAGALSESTMAEWQRKYLLKGQINSLVAALPPLEALLDSGHAHPYAVYLALAGLAGQIAAASPGMIPELPSDKYAYQHEDLLSTFRSVRDVLKVVRDGIHESFDTLVLGYDLQERRYQVELPADWKTRNLALCVSTRRGEQSGVDLDAWVKDALIGVRSQMPKLSPRRATGVTRKPREQVADPALKDLLREIEPPENGAVYWLDRGSADLEGTGPFIVLNGGDDRNRSDLFQITLYISHPEPTGKTEA